MRIPVIAYGRALVEAAGDASFGSAVQDSETHSHRVAAPTVIEISRAREHNLKNIDIDLGRNRFTVIPAYPAAVRAAWLSTSSSPRTAALPRIPERVCTAIRPTRSRPDVDAIFGIPPTVAIEQRTSRGGHKSTVATLTEIYHFLRLMYVKLGVQYCPACDAPIEPQSATPLPRVCSKTTAVKKSPSSRR